jgi:hypothetical protein
MRAYAAGLVAGLCLAFAAPAAADMVHLKNGKTLEGVVTRTAKGVQVEQRFGTVLIPHGEVEKIELRQTPEQVLAERLAELKAGDAEGALDLASFCLEHELTKAARELALERVLPHAPDDRRLHHLLRALDFHLERGQWLPPEVYYPRKGFVRHKGAWITHEAMAVRVARGTEEAREQDLKAALKRAEEASRDLARAQQRLAWTEEEIAQVAADRARLPALRQAAEVALRAREQDLALASMRALEARRQFDGWRARHCGCAPAHGTPHVSSCGWESRRAWLWGELSRAQRLERDARAGRDAAANEVQRLLHEEARLADREAAARAELPRAQAQIAPARARLDRAIAAQGRAQAARDQAARAHEQAKAAARAKRKG